MNANLIKVSDLKKEDLINRFENFKEGDDAAALAYDFAQYNKDFDYYGFIDSVGFDGSDEYNDNIQLTINCILNKDQEFINSFKDQTDDIVNIDGVDYFKLDEGIV